MDFSRNLAGQKGVGRSIQCAERKKVKMPTKNTVNSKSILPKEGERKFFFSNTS